MSRIITIHQKWSNRAHSSWFGAMFFALRLHSRVIPSRMSLRFAISHRKCLNRGQSSWFALCRNDNRIVFAVKRVNSSLFAKTEMFCHEHFKMLITFVTTCCSPANRDELPRFAAKATRLQIRTQDESWRTITIWTFANLKSNLWCDSCRNDLRIETNYSRDSPRTMCRIVQNGRECTIFGYS